MANPFAEELQKRSQNPFKQEMQRRTPTQQEDRGGLQDQFQVGSEMLGGTLRGAGETGLQFLTGSVAEPIAGLAGIFQSTAGRGVEAAPETIERTREALTYQPRSVGGQAVSREVAEQLQPVGEALSKAGEITGELGYQAGGPVGGAIGATIPAAIVEVAGLKGTRAAKQRALEQAVAESGAGIITPEARETLLRSGFTDEQLRRATAQDADQLERLARFQRLGIKPTRGDITQDLDAQKAEAQLFETAQDEAGATMRRLRRQQSEQMAGTIEGIIEQTGAPQEVGDAIKRALQERKTITKEKAKAAYDALAQEQAATNVPLMVGDYRSIENIPDAGEIRDISAIKPAETKALQNLLAEFGMSDDPKAIQRLEAEGVVPQQLSLANFERFRKRLASIERADQTGNLGRITGPIRRELDKQVDAMSETLETSGNSRIAELAKDARMNWKAYKEEFDPKALTEQLIKDRPKSTIPQVESSEVYTKIAANSVPVEQVDRLYQSLRGAGALGRRAIADLQSSVLLDVLDSGFKGVTRKIDGQQTISGAAMAKRFDKLSDKAKIVFQDNPQALRQLQDVVETAKDITPQSTAIPKGSAGFFMDLMDQVGVLSLARRIPGGDIVVQGLRDLGARGANEKALKRALKEKPQLNRAATIMATDYPSLATALGLGFMVRGEDENDTNQQQ